MGSPITTEVGQKSIRRFPARAIWREKARMKFYCKKEQQTV